MKLAIMQPYFFPYLGYFQLIDAVDKFIIYDDVNFIKKGWIHRNKILINNAPFLFTIPCKRISQNKLIHEIALDFDNKKKEKFLKMIELAYKKASFFSNFYPLLHDFINQDKSEDISRLATNSIRFVCKYLGLSKQFEFSSKNHSDSFGMEKQERLKYIASKEKAVTYINSSGGKILYDKESFNDRGVQLKFLKTSNIKYPQNNSSFVPWLSIIDVVMFNSIEQTKNLLFQYKLE